MFKTISSTNNLFRYYRTPTSFTTDRLRPQIKLIAEVPYLLVPTENSFYVYRLENLKLHFIGPMIEGLSGLYFNEYNILVSTGDVIHRVDRGEIIDTYQFNGTVREVVKFGEYFIVRLDDMEIVVLEQILDNKQSALPVDSGIDEILTSNEMSKGKMTGEWEDICDKNMNTVNKGEFMKEVYRFKGTEKIRTIFHPHSYSNKILIIYESGKIDIYNILSRKTIFSFNFGCKVIGVGQTSVLDVVGFILEDNTVRIFNIKKNKKIFDIPNYRNSESHRSKGDIGEDASKIKCQLDFKGNIALIVINGNLMIYNLETKRELFLKHGVYSGLLVNEGMFLAVSAGSIEIYDMDGFSLLKKRSMISGEVQCVESIGPKEILLVGANRLFRMNIYKDEQNVFMKNTKDIGLVSVRENVLAYGENRVEYHDKEGAFHRFIERRCDWIKTFEQFCFIGYGKRCIVMNLKSKRTIFDYTTEDKIIDGDFNNEKIVILTSKALRIFNYKKEELFLFPLEDLCGFNESSKEFSSDSLPKDRSKDKSNSAGEFSKFKHVELANNLYLVQGEFELFVICDGVHRKFSAERYKLDLSTKYLAAISGGIFRLYDLSTGCVIDEMEGNTKFKDVVIVDNLKFIGLLDDENNFHLFYNHAFFNRTDSSFISASMGVLPLNIKMEKKESNFDKELAMYKRFGTGSEDLIKGLGKEEVSGLLKIIESNLDNITTQTVLAQLLKYKNDMIEPLEVKNILLKIEKQWRMNEDGLLKVLGYLKITK